MIFSVMYVIWAELTAIPEESTLQKANGAGVKGDMKFSSNLDKSLVNISSRAPFSFQIENMALRNPSGRSTGITHNQPCKSFCEQFLL